MNDVLFIDDVARELRISRRTIEKLRRHRAFQIPEMPRLDKRPRWSREAVEAFKASQQAGEPKKTLRLVKSRAAR